MPLKSILIVDDDRNLRQSMALILRRAYYQVDTAGSATDALKSLETSHYDLTIIDMMVQDEGSILLPRLLKKYPNLPVLILTAQVSPETSAEAAHRGPHFRVTKPLTPETLLQQVGKLLNKAAGSEKNKTGLSSFL